MICGSLKLSLLYYCLAVAVSVVLLLFQLCHCCLDQNVVSVVLLLFVVLLLSLLLMILFLHFMNPDGHLTIISQCLKDLINIGHDLYTGSIFVSNVF